MGKSSMFYLLDTENLSSLERRLECIVKIIVHTMFLCSIIIIPSLNCFDKKRMFREIIVFFSFFIDIK